MKRKKILFMTVVTPILAFAQSLTLDECQKLAHDNYPAIKQYGLVERMRDYTVDNAAKGWLPQVEAQAGAYAFTDIINASDQMKQMGFSTNNIVANGMVSVKQLVYDGGQIAAGKEVAKAQAQVQLRQLDVSMHDVRERVEQLFFGVLTIDERLSQNAILQADLQVSASTVESLMRNGLANQGDLNTVSVEVVKAQQQADALSVSRQAYLRMLGTLVGKPLSTDTKMEKPDMALPTAKDSWGTQRPEMAFYESQNQLIDTQLHQLDTRLRPTVGLTGMGMLHTKVSDLAHNGLLLGGVTLSWNIGAFYTRKNDIHKLETQRLQIHNMRDIFLFNNRLQNEETEGSVQSLRKQIEKDCQIVKLQESIRDTKEKKVRLGTESVSELVRSVNAVAMARQQQSLHELQLLQAIYHSNTINQ